MTPGGPHAARHAAPPSRAWLLGALLALGCASGPRAAPQEPPGGAPTPRAEPTSTSETGAAPVALRLATFNLRVLGPTKAGRPEVLAALAEIIRRYDLVAVQEIRDVSGEAPARLLAAVNAHAGGTRYAMALSPRTGREPDDRASQEQYAYLYRVDRVREAGEALLYDDSERDDFQREPYLGRFVLVGTDRTFVLINVHTRPRSALREIAAMEHVFVWARATFTDDRVFIALGDFNAGCGYASEEDLDALPIHGEAYDWVVPHSADTNVAEGACPYDRVVVAAPGGSDLVTGWGVDREGVDDAVSDHFPVWVDLAFPP